MKSVLIPAFFLYLATQSTTMGFHCSNVLDIETDGLLNYLGNVTFLAPEASMGEWKLIMKTDVPFTFIGGWQVWVQSDADAGMATFRSRRTDLDIAQGEQVSMRFRISWGRNSQRPQVISLLWNDNQLCQ